MYKQYLKVKPAINGLGVFTTIKIPAETPIIEATGQVNALSDIKDPNEPALLQVGPDTYMGPTGDIVPDYINHSCEPNCYFHIVGNRAILYSLYVIPAGAELTFDYSTTSTESKDTWVMECKCGSYKCRKIISGFQYLDPALQEHYKSKNILPLYITHNILQPR
jgi:SET domain-containing protein